MIPRYTPLKRGKPPKNKRAKPRPGRLQGAEMDALRLAVWIRDKGRCVKCGYRVILDAPQELESSFHLAHRKGKRMWGDSLETTEANCGKCHRKFHAYGPTMEKPCPPKPTNQQPT